jgi:glycosyltransferase involved in cell wall biosynthesis
LIAQVCPRYFPYIGGVETHVKEISERLERRDFEIHVLTTDPFGELPKEEIIKNVKVIRFKSWAPGEAYYFSRDLKDYLKKNSSEFNLVHAHNYQAFPSLYAAQTKGKNKLVFTPHYHGTGHTFFRSMLHIPYKLFGKKIFEKADRIICVSNHEKNLCVKNFNINEEKIKIIPNGVNLMEFKGLRKRKKNYQSVLSVGRLEKYKGLQHLIRVLPKLSTDMILEVVGSGPYKKSLVELARKLKVEDRVNFFQGLPRNELLRKYVDADVFVSLSEREAYGMSVGEALSAGTPCIVANESALKEWIDDQNCFGIDYPISLSKLKNLIMTVIGKRVKNLEMPDWNEVTEKLVSLYESC